MHDEGKMGPMAAAIDRGTRTPSPCLPILLLQVRDKAALQLRQGLQALFDNADDTLFEMADKATSSLEQHLYFEAMRDLRLKRKSIERGFLDIYYDTFSRIGQDDPMGQLAALDLSRSKAQMERTVAVGAMVERVLARDGFALGLLGQRFEALLDQPLALRSNPLGPGCLCGFFLEAGRNLGVDLRVKLVLLTLFERYVLRDCDLLYGEANQLLAAAGVLPELLPLPRRRLEDSRRASRHVPSGLSADEAQGAASAGEAFIASLEPLLMPLRGSLAPRLQNVATAQPIGSADLLRLLTHLQHYVPTPDDADDFDLGQQLEQLLLRVSVRSGTRRRLQIADEDMINLVGLLFGYIQTDDNLSPPVRGLIGRLHIPLLKVALLDKSLFSRATHPARRLLNEIAAAAIGCEGLDAALQARVENIVQRLLSDFDEDPQLFTQLLEEFLALRANERRRHDLLEQRTREVAQGTAHTRQARQRVERELNQRLRGRVLPEAVVRMLVEAWSQVMLLAWLKQGEHSAAWQAALANMDALLASIAPRPAPQDRQQLLEQLPGLLKALREGLGGVALDSASLREFFLQLERLHLDACADSPHGEAAPLVLVEDAIVLVVADEPDAAPMPQLDPLSPELRQVQRLRIGTWVELADDEEPLRCKLVARVDSADRLVFANRTGMKAREWTSAGLALALHRGEARVLDDGLLFERALDAALETLQLSVAR